MQTPISPWRHIQRTNLTKLEDLISYLSIPAEIAKNFLSDPKFSLNLPRRLADKIDINNPLDPILLQFVPLIQELVQAPGFTEEPLQDQRFQKSDKILQKYHGRALILATSACAMHCRFCFRQNFPYATTTVGFEKELQYLQNDPSIHEVILSGGDPLSLSDEQLRSLFTSLNSIPHLQRIRFHTRFPIGIPERIDDSFLQILKSSSKQIFFIIHSNHPIELDTDVLSALKKIQRLGIPVLNQAVLLKNVNDNPATMLQLCELLTNHGLLPYYIHQLDPVTGTSHFASPANPHTIIQHIQEHLSGFGVPRLVQEIPGQKSKTFLA
jgi:EF-P beta-lysylation protein EpmB